jgi:two-component system LytT family response regulator
MRVFLVDDEPLALKRLKRMLEAADGVDICGMASDPVKAVGEIRRAQPDVIMLDIEMPVLSGFGVLEQLGEPQPLVVFTTAFDQYALQAFEVNSIDYLLKPVEAAQLNRALAKLKRVLGGEEARAGVGALLAEMRRMIERRDPEFLTRVASRVGDRVEFIELSLVSHFYARDKLTFAAAANKHHAIDLTIAELEAKLDPARWIRIHRSTLLNLDHVKELFTWFGGKVLVRLRDGQTELAVARERAAEVRSKLGA